MLVYVALVALILILNTQRKSGNMSNKAFCVVISIAFILITGLRHNDVGSDTTVYYINFHDYLKYLTFEKLWNLEKRDFGAYILMWAIARYTGSFEVLTMVVAVLYYVAVGRFIYKYSDDMGLSYIVLMAFMFFQFSMTGMRQTMAFAFSILFITEILAEKPKWIRSFIFIALAIVMHRSAVIVFAYLILRRFRNVKHYLGILGLIPFTFIFRSRLTSMGMDLFERIGFDFANYEESTGGLTTYIVYIILFLIGLFFTKHYDKESGEGMPFLYLIIMGIATAAQSFVFVNSVFFRVVWYFAFILVVYIPKLITTIKVNEQSRGTANFVMYAAMLIMYFGITIGSAVALPYKFFWQ